MTYLFFVLGLVLLIGGAELLVRGAANLAGAIGIPPLIVGLTVVAFGTSAPEFAVSINSALAGEPNIAVGNVIGSNVFNVLFILGISAMVTPLIATKQLIQIDVPVMIVASLVVLAFGWNMELSRIEGGVLFASMIIYTLILVLIGLRSARAKRAADRALTGEYESNPKIGSGLNATFVVLGFIGLAFGARWLVESSVIIAQDFGLSETVIGLTIIAVGTSLPEVVTSVMASIKGERDLAIGNVVGSNLFNLMGVLGVAAMFSGNGIQLDPSVARFDFPVMAAVSIVCLPIFFTGGVISRWEGAVLFGYYLAYTAYLLLKAADYSNLEFMSNTMLYFVVPLTVLTVFVTSVNEIRRRKKRVTGESEADNKLA